LDTNAGADETHAWLHSPGMKNCASNCGSFTLAPDNGVIFRGGDTYHFGNSGLTPYAGVVTGCALNGTADAGLCIDDINGTGAHPIYYGVDKTWFTGGSWVRPTLTADNPVCNSGTAGTLPDGATCTVTTDSFGQPSYYVSACGFQVGNTNNLVDIGFAQNIIFDNFELTGLCQNHVGQPGGEDAYIYYGSDQAPVTFENVYIHGATHLHYAALNGSVGCTGSTVCINLNAFYGSVTVGSVGETITNSVVDFADSDPGGENLCQCGFYNVAFNVFRYTTQAIPSNLHLVHDNLYEYFFENGHSNAIESEDVGPASAVYNNVFRHMENLVSSGGGVLLWTGQPTGGNVDYIFNNVFYDVGALEYVNLGGLGITTNNGNYVIFNNTLQSNPNQPILRCSSGSDPPSLKDSNNHFIDDGSQYLSCGGNKTSVTANLMSNATATSNGYTSAQTFAYSPTSAGSPTVGTGTNENATNGAYCSALTTAGLSAAASACQSDTTYACSYAGSGAAPVCPARTTNARPVSAAWDIGAYQFSAVSSIDMNFTGLSVTGLAVQQ
jgi:hypothetical protein